MKKSLLALAVLGAFAGAASAQSSVTLYGRVDLSAAKDSGTDNKSLQNGSGSRLGVRGVEDLGGGLSAIFNIEHRFNADTGTQSDSSKFWFGRSIVGLQGDWGSVVLGREYTVPFSFSQNAWDPWGHDTVVSTRVNVNGGSGANVGGTAGLTRLGGIAKARNDNSITYKFSAAGFSAGAQIAEATDSGAGIALPNRPWNVGGRYMAGPIDVAVAYESTGAEDANGKEKILSVDGSYNFGVVKIGAYFAKGYAVGNYDRRSAAGFVTVPLGAGELRMIGGRVWEDDNVGGSGYDTLNTLGGIGYHYSLSKRTVVYADFVRNTGTYVVSKNGYDVGIKHNF